MLTRHPKANIKQSMCIYDYAAQDRVLDCSYKFSVSSFCISFNYIELPEKNVNREENRAEDRALEQAKTY